VAAAATIIVSGDRDLLALKKHREIEVLKVAEFMGRIRSE
jgi:predicted nucleic acid-binding protein